MPQSIKIAGKIIRVGDRLRGNYSAPERGLGREGDLVTVVQIQNNMVGLRSEKRLEGWGDLDGTLPQRQGYWATRDCIHDNFELVESKFIVNADVQYKKHSLKGMRCTLLRDIGHGEHSFVELEKDVGGGSADGLGKSGYCVLVPAGSLKEMPVKKPKSKPKKKTNKKEV
jgi:hypothetical protein